MYLYMILFFFLYTTVCTCKSLMKVVLVLSWPSIVYQGISSQDYAVLVSTLCRMCHEHEETIQHLLSGCPALVTWKVCHVVHWHLCKFFRLSTSDSSWYGHVRCILWIHAVYKLRCTFCELIKCAAVYKLLRDL